MAVTARRKLVQHGPSSLIVSLPARWVKLNNLKKGDEVLLEENSKSLVLSVDTLPSQLSLTQDVTDLPAFLITKFLVRSYQKGYDEIRLIHNNPEMLRIIQQEVQELIGYEIIEQDDKSCLIRSITPTIDLSFDNSLRKAFLIIRDMLEICAKAYATGDYKTLENLHLRDFEVNRLCSFCLRHMNKHGSTDPSQAHQRHVQYYLVEVLEDVGDVIKGLATDLSHSERTSEDIAQLLDSVRQLADRSYEYFYKPTLAGAIETHALFTDLRSRIDSLAGEKLRKQEMLAVMWCKEIIVILNHFTTMRLDFL